MWTVLPWHVPLYGRCGVSKNYLSDSIRAKRPPKSASPHKTSEEANSSDWKNPSPKYFGPRPLIRIFHTLQGFVQRPNWIFEVFFPDTCSQTHCAANPVVLTRVDLTARVGLRSSCVRSDCSARRPSCAPGRRTQGVSPCEGNSKEGVRLGGVRESASSNDDCA